MSHELNDEQIVSNEDAARAMLALMGGIAGYFNASPAERRNLAQILDADPENDLSGLRLLAQRMQSDTIEAVQQSNNSEDRFIEPEVARWWLETRRAEYMNGNSMSEPKPDHLAHAALKIAESGTGAYFYDVYKEVSDSRQQLTLSIVSEFVDAMVKDYVSNVEQEARALAQDSTEI